MAPVCPAVLCQKQQWANLLAVASVTSISDAGPLSGLFVPLCQHLLGHWEPIGSWKLLASNVLSMQHRAVRGSTRKIFLGHGFWHNRKDLSGVIAGSPLPNGFKRLEGHLSKMTILMITLLWLEVGRWTKWRYCQLPLWEPIFISGQCISKPPLCRPVAALRFCFAHQGGDQGADLSSLWVWACLLSTWLSCREKKWVVLVEQPHVIC